MLTQQSRARRYVVKSVKLLLVALAVLFAAAQFIRPERTNPPVAPGRSIESHVRMTPEVASLLERSCDDCHSNRTDWPWYSRVAPASWFVVDHVNHGRTHLNFSDWARYDDEEAAEVLEQICIEAKKGAMPLDSYTLIHRDAKLSHTDITTLCNWTNGERQRLASARISTQSAR
ncbi:MAG TPA: heme-binding domain-containing protein [Pyrinomonadaceae bacterium]